MKIPSLQLPLTYLCLIFILKCSLVHGREQILLNPDEAGFLPQRLLQSNQYTCPANNSCALRARADKTYAITLEAPSDVLVILDVLDQPEDLMITYTSSVSSPYITSEMMLRPQNVPISAPSGKSWTFTVDKSTIQDGGAQFLWDVENESKVSTTITFKMSFASSSDSSSQSDSDSQGASEGGSMLKILLPVFAALAFLMILGVWCHHRKARRQRLARFAMARRQRGQRGVNNNGQGDEEEEEDPLTEANLAERFPEAKIEEIKSSFPQTTCSICLEEFQKQVSCRQLYCEHVFHSECIKLWLTNQLKKGHPFCPNCNKDMMRKVEKVEEAGNQTE